MFCVDHTITQLYDICTSKIALKNEILLIVTVRATVFPSSKQTKVITTYFDI